MLRPCANCKKIFDEKDLQLHHFVPRCIGGQDSDGRAFICKKCHEILHLMLLKIAWLAVDELNRQKIKNAIKTFSERKLR